MPAPHWSAPQPTLGHHDHVRDHVHDLHAASSQGAITKNGHDHEHGHVHVREHGDDHVHDHGHDHEHHDHVHDHDHDHDLCAAPIAGP